MNVKECYRMVVYGDSISKGIIFDEVRQRYVTLQESFTDLLQKEFNGAIYAVGKFGNTVTAGAEKLQRLVLEKEPDLVLLEFGGNDCDYNWEEVANEPFKSHSPKTEVSVFKDRLIDMIATIRSNHAEPVLMTLPPLDADKYFNWISKNDPNYARNILVWLKTISRIYWWHERYNAAIISIAEKTGTKLIDVRGAFLQEEDFRDMICIDGIHPNERGHRVIAQKIINYAKENYGFLLAGGSKVAEGTF